MRHIRITENYNAYEDPGYSSHYLAYKGGIPYSFNGWGIDLDTLSDSEFDEVCETLERHFPDLNTSLSLWENYLLAK